MNRCIEASSPPAGLTVHLVEGHTVDLHIAGVTAGTLHWADGRRVEVAPSLPGAPSGDGLGWSLDGDLTAELRAAGVAYVQLVADDRVLMAGDVAWHSGWRGSCQPHQRVVYVSGPPGGPGVGIADVTAVDGVATITLTDGTVRTIDLPPGADGHTPVVGLDGDRLTVDGVPVGESLRGPAGHTPEVIVSGDVVTIDGQSTDPLTSTIPGPPTALSIGEVATLPPSSPATAQIIGEPPSQTLTLGIPRGEVGPASTVPGPPGAVATAGDYLIVGPGRPDTPATTGGAITGSEPVGAEYRSTDGAGVGAWAWMKRPGGKWEVTDGDTGWRRIEKNANVVEYVSDLAIRRVGSRVYYAMHAALAGNSVPFTGGPRVTHTLPLGWWFNYFVAGPVYDGSKVEEIGSGYYYQGNIGFTMIRGSSNLDFEISANVKYPWPTAPLPGTPV